MADLTDIVSSRVKSEIFRLLFGLGQPELHLRELARQAGLSVGTVRQELQKLTHADLVSGRKDGNRVYYRANRNHPVHNDLRALVAKTGGLAELLKQRLDDPRIRVAFVFGSVARGEARAQSDVDLIVIGSLGLRALAGLLSGAADEIGREINPHVFTEAEWCERKAQGGHFVTAMLAAPKLFVKGTAHELEAVGQ